MKSKIKFVCSNNAPELSFSDFFCKDQVISVHPCIDTSQQNSMVERKHQHILNVARTLHFQSHIPLRHWGDCILTSIYLINRMSSPILTNKTPFELLWNKKPSCNHHREFGCLCYVFTLLRHCIKFSSPSMQAVFLGCPVRYKRYKLFDLATNTTFISKDVVFSQRKFSLPGSVLRSSSF